MFSINRFRRFSEFFDRKSQLLLNLVVFVIIASVLSGIIALHFDQKNSEVIDRIQVTKALMDDTLDSKTDLIRGIVFTNQLENETYLSYRQFENPSQLDECIDYAYVANFMQRDISPALAGMDIDGNVKLELIRARFDEIADLINPDSSGSDLCSILGPSILRSLLEEMSAMMLVSLDYYTAKQHEHFTNILADQDTLKNNLQNSRFAILVTFLIQIFVFIGVNFIDLRMTWRAAKE